jgi:uncharacterized membrane protein (UPF0127 family)
MLNDAASPYARSRTNGGRAALAAVFLKSAFAGAVVAFAALAGAAYTVPAHAEEPTAAQAKLPTTRLSVGIHVINAEIANTEEQRRTGLMFRPPLEGNDGMIFVFEDPDMQCFWMHNTPVPLSIAFIGADGEIVNVDEMAAETDTPHCSRKPVRYALEMAKGWFADHGVKAGKKMEGLP